MKIKTKAQTNYISLHWLPRL